MLVQENLIRRSQGMLHRFADIDVVSKLDRDSYEMIALAFSFGSGRSGSSAIRNQAFFRCSDCCLMLNYDRFYRC